ncbi:GntR family transcriptional regulator [Clostridium sp. OS1-26]|uniref:GntR family transcriptional regulator n=1 Tax=Clostridium sp. OS1-26 TaxID=3070681 RepID=UPI0027E0E8A0|nr:GntR family transcriptional regulator [Clostridium sp. OS1-26]WML32658.1 GntR family transcriptional regulator [Clostridium sp. OS1-26]
MKFSINKKVDFPIYQQLKEQIKYFLLSGALQAGEKVPSPIQLEKLIKINRNTVISAYKELEKEGLLVSKSGQGTYVSDNINVYNVKKHNQELLTLAQETIEKTKQLGFKPDDLFTVIFNYTVLGLNDSKRICLKALLIESAVQDLEYFRDVLIKELNIDVDICLLSELQDSIDSEIVRNCDFVITGFNHVEDVKATMEPLGKEVIGLMATPRIHAFMRIAQLNPGTKVGIVCATAHGALNMKKAIENAGVQNVTISTCGAENKKQLLEMLQKVDAVITSRVAFDTVKALLPSGVQLLEFFSELDRNGLQMLKQYINNKVASK